MVVYDDLTIKQLKSRIQYKINVAPKLQLIRFKRHVLWHESKTLSYYRITNNSQLTIRVYTEQKIKKLRQQYIFTKSVSKAYNSLEMELSTTNISESDMKSEFDSKTLYEMAFREEIEWSNLDNWMYDKLRGYLYDISERSATKTNTNITNNINIHNNHHIHYPIPIPPSPSLSPNIIHTQSSIKPIKAIKYRKSRSKSNKSVSFARNYKKQVKYRNNKDIYKIHDNKHRFNSFIFVDKLFCCHDGYKINLKRYVFVMFFLFILMGIGSLFVGYEQSKLQKLSDDYYILSTCHVYNQTYAIWYGYNEYNGHGNECYQKTKNELRVTQWHGTPEFPDNNYNINATNYSYIEYIAHDCYVTPSCNEIILTTSGSGLDDISDDPYKWDAQVLLICVLFMWLLCIVSIVVPIYLCISKTIKKRKYFINQWENTPNDWKCEYYFKYYSNKYKFNSNSNKQILYSIYKYYSILYDDNNYNDNDTSNIIIYEQSKTTSKSKSKSKDISIKYRKQTASFYDTDTEKSRDKTASRESI